MNGGMIVKKNILDRKFVHHAWFKGSNITRKQAIEYFASNFGDFTLKRKYYKIQADNLLDNIEYDYILYGSEDGRSWRISNEEAAYYLSRVEFYKEFWKTHNFSELLNIPEYKEYTLAVND